MQAKGVPKICIADGGADLPERRLIRLSGSMR